MPIYAAAVFISAFLLFQVQPVLGKFILPRYGGGAAVWTACLLFFQVMLLAGYAWAHAIRRWLPGSHRRVHAVLLTATVLSIPILPPPAQWLAADVTPTWSIVALLLVTIGAPYMALAATGPLLQSWFADRFPQRSPYRLYALSNVGSLLGLLTYPVLVEPLLTRDAQVIGWSALYLVLVLLLLAAAFSAPRRARVDATPRASSPAPPVRQIAGWLVLAASGSTLLMAVTNHLSQEVAVVPFLWVLPLALYLTSFIVAFDSDRWYDRRVFGILLAVLVPTALWALRQGLSLDFRWGIAIWSGLLFVLCTCCHGELARQRPAADRLTLFYLAVSAGGALGGIFVGVVAPLVFTGYWELHLGILLTLALVLDSWLVSTKDWSPIARRVTVAASVGALVLVGVAVLQDLRDFGEDVVVASRDFYGVLRVVYDEDPEVGDSLQLYHGQTKHGFQYVNLAKRRERVAYYAPESGIGMAIERHPRRGDDRLEIGVVGLGVGMLAAYGRAGDRVRFWELDPAVEWVARAQFSYLEDSPASVDVVLGDARLAMAAELRSSATQYDVLAIDAFSSDAIPVHLLTAEAMALYWRLLRPDGLLAIHISNRFVDLEPVVRALARSAGVAVLRFKTDRSSDRGVSRSTWLVLARPGNPFLESAAVRATGTPVHSGPEVLWSDDFASLWPVLEFD